MKTFSLVESFRGPKQIKKARAWVTRMSQQEGCIAGCVDTGYAETSAHVSFEASDSMRAGSLPDGCAMGML